MFKIKAKFIGINSLGFISGRIYEMILINAPHIGKGIIEVATENKPRLRCEYSSWEKFIPNWEILHYEKMTTGNYDAEVHHTKVNKGLKSSVRESKINKLLNK